MSEITKRPSPSRLESDIDASVMTMQRDGIYAVPNDDAGRARETANICVAIGATDAVSCTDKALAPAGPSAEDSVGCADSCSVRVTPGAYATAWS